jgi:hypothetical protein
VERGLTIAAVFSLYAIVTRIVAGPGAFDQYHMTVVSLVATYVGGALLGGTMVGLLRPITKNPFGAALVGFITAVPITAVLVRFLDEAKTWSSFDTYIVVLGSLAYGVLPALVWLKRSTGAKEESTPTSDDIE